MQKRNAPEAQARVRERGRHHDQQPIWRKTTPRGNQQVDRADMQRSTERLEMLLGH
jgi:hypothetical protein